MTKLTDAQVVGLFFDMIECPSGCGQRVSPVDGCSDWSATATWECAGRDDGECDWEGTPRELVENALRRTGILAAEPPVGNLSANVDNG